MPPAAPTHFPLLVTYRDFLEGNGFAAHVEADGRALAHQEEDGSWWVDGVNPGGMAAGGATLREAHFELLDTFHKVMLDLSKDEPDFASFEAAVVGFFRETDEATVREWNAAVAAVRSGVTSSDLPHVREEDRPARIAVVRRVTFKPADKPLVNEPLVAA